MYLPVELPAILAEMQLQTLWRELCTESLGSSKPEHWLDLSTPRLKLVSRWHKAATQVYCMRGEDEWKAQSGISLIYIQPTIS